MEPFKLRYREAVAVKTEDYHRVNVGPDGYVQIRLDSNGTPRLISTHRFNSEPLSMALVSAAIDDFMERRREDAAVKAGIQAAVDDAVRTGVAPAQGCAGEYMDKAKRSLEDQWRLLGHGWLERAADGAFAADKEIAAERAKARYALAQANSVQAHGLEEWGQLTESGKELLAELAEGALARNRELAAAQEAVAQEKVFDPIDSDYKPVPAKDYPQAKLDSVIRYGQRWVGEECPHCGDGPGNWWLGWYRSYGHEPATCRACHGKFWPADRSFRDAVPKTVQKQLAFTVGPIQCGPLQPSLEFDLCRDPSPMDDLVTRSEAVAGFLKRSDVPPHVRLRAHTWLDKATALLRAATASRCQPSQTIAVGDQVMLRLSPVEEQRLVIRERVTDAWRCDGIGSDGTMLPGPMWLSDQRDSYRKIDPIPLKEPVAPRLLERGPKVYCQGEEMP